MPSLLFFVASIRIRIRIRILLSWNYLSGVNEVVRCGKERFVLLVLAKER
jgi:hypothetical protein